MKSHIYTKFIKKSVTRYRLLSILLRLGRHLSCPRLGILYSQCHLLHLSAPEAHTTQCLGGFSFHSHWPHCAGGQATDPRENSRRDPRPSHQGALWQVLSQASLHRDRTGQTLECCVLSGKAGVLGPWGPETEPCHRLERQTHCL